jgi:mRNA-degrading endonuclease toxin of MazEF toxin-antitoxin module
MSVETAPLVVSPDTVNERMQDLVLVAITSHLTDDRLLIIERDDCVDGTLPQTSVVKPAKLFTIHSTIVLKKICALRSEKLQAVLAEIRRLFS